MTSSGPKFSVVEFLCEDSIEVVPSLWIEGSKCYWPPTDVSRRVKKSEIPDKEKWSCYEVKVRATANTYEQAQKRAKRAIMTSNIETSDEDDLCARKRKLPSRYTTVSDSDVDDDELDVEQIHKPKKRSLSSPPLATNDRQHDEGRSPRPLPPLTTTDRQHDEGGSPRPLPPLTTTDRQHDEGQSPRPLPPLTTPDRQHDEGRSPRPLPPLTTTDRQHDEGLSPRPLPPLTTTHGQHDEGRSPRPLPPLTTPDRQHDEGRSPRPLPPLTTTDRQHDEGRSPRPLPPLTTTHGQHDEGRSPRPLPPLTTPDRQHDEGRSPRPLPPLTTTDRQHDEGRSPRPLPPLKTPDRQHDEGRSPRPLPPLTTTDRQLDDGRSPRPLPPLTTTDCQHDEGRSPRPLPPLTTTDRQHDEGRSPRPLPPLTTTDRQHDEGRSPRPMPISSGLLYQYCRTKFDESARNQQHIIELLSSIRTPELEDDMTVKAAESIQEMNSFCEQIDNSTDFRRKLVKHLCRTGGHNIGDFIRTTMKILATNQVWAKFSVKGKKGKYAFEKSPLYRVLIKAALKNFNLQAVDVSDEIGEFLKHAPFKPGGPNYKKKRTHTETGPAFPDPGC